MSSVPSVRSEKSLGVRSPRRVITLMSIALPLLALSGCAVGDFIGAYFNTYYNARRAFIEAEDELLKGQPPRPTTEQQTYLPPYTVPAGAKTKFTTVIDKCSKLLQYHPESAYVDDALLMIGKSYYYQNEHQQAERKFRELLDRFADGSLAFETRLLLANTLYRASDVAGARTAARTLSEDAEAAGEDAVLAGSCMLLAHCALQAQDTATALIELDRAAEAATTDAMRTAAWQTSADLLANLGRPGDALRAYRRAASSAEDAPREYRARIGEARMLSRLGEYDDAVSRMEDLLDITANKEYFPEIDFEIGNTFRDQGDLEAAITQYRYVDTAHVRSEFAARAGYQLGMLYEDPLLQYDSARSAYQRARSLAGQSTIAPLVTRKAEIFTRYFTLHTDLARQESLKVLIIAPPESLLAALDSVRAHADSLIRARRDSLAASVPATDSLQAADSTVAAPDTLRAAADTTAGAAPDSGATTPARPPLVSVPLDTVEARIALACSELGSLFFTGIERRDSAEYWFTRLLTDYPASPHVPRALYALAQLADRDSGDPARADSLYHILAAGYPRSEFGLAAARHIGVTVETDTDTVARRLYGDGERALLGEKPRAALKAFQAVSSEHPASPFAPRAQYAIGWIYEEVVNEPESALVYYRRLIEAYPQSEYAGVVRPRVAAVDQHLQAIEAEAKRVKDSTAAAQAAPPPKEEPAPPAEGKEQPAPGEPVEKGKEPPPDDAEVPPETPRQPEEEPPPGVGEEEAPPDPGAGVPPEKPPPRPWNGAPR